MGEGLNFSFNIISQEKKKINIVIDYIIYHKKANGKKSPKVFKLRNMVLKPGGDKPIRKFHGIKPITTRKYYSGEHSLSLKVNGKEVPIGHFELTI